MRNEIKNGVLVIYPEGNLTGLEISAPVVQLIKSNINAGIKKVVFNLHGVKFIGSIGFGVLLTVLLKTRKAGGEMILCNIPEQMQELLEITKLETIFNQQRDEAAALKYLSGSKGNGAGPGV